jgi:hypothetical protein
MFQFWKFISTIINNLTYIMNIFIRNGVGHFADITLSSVIMIELPISIDISLTPLTS